MKPTNDRNYRLGFEEAFWRTAFDGPALLRLARREVGLDMGGSLYHYTTVAGLFGIVSDRGFWASDHRFLNDAQEMSHGTEIAAEVIDHVLAKPRIAEFTAVLAEVRRRVVEPPRVGNLIACFSRVRDSLEQWRAYGGGGGVCIKVRGEGVPPERPKTRQPMFYGPDMLAHRVLYRRRPKLTMIVSLIRRYEAEYGLDLAAMPDDWPDDHDEHYRRNLGGQLLQAVRAFKNAAFEQEAEVRVVIPFENADRFGGLKFRAAAAGLIPYVCTGGRWEGDVDIAEVLVGPSPHQDLIASSVRTFLDVKGYPEVPVQRSTVPYRSY